MKEVIAESAALEMVAAWEDELESSLSQDQKDIILKRVKAGRVDYSEGAFTLKLIKPIRMDNGKEVQSIRIYEPSGKHIADMAKRKESEIEQAIRLLSMLTELPIGVVERIGERDLNAASALLGFFG